MSGLTGTDELELIEPLRELFKDEVRELGEQLGLSEAIVWRHPFPGPGLAVRILGEVTPERVRVLQEADAIAIEEIRKANLYRAIWQAFVVLLPVRSVASWRRPDVRARGRAQGRGGQGWHDCRLVSNTPRCSCTHFEPYHQRSPRHQPCRVRHLVQAAKHHRMGVGAARPPTLIRDAFQARGGDQAQEIFRPRQSSRILCVFLSGNCLKTLFCSRE